ncbi:MAG: hypothetical protein JWP22_3250 [Ramlibacter sp.]|nr:hypothetical protein [Ramlibacter sp.]
MDLGRALLELGLLGPKELARLARQEPRLLGPHCGELVTRGWLTHQALARALGRMTGWPHVQEVNLELAPAAFLRMLLAPPGTGKPPPPARSLAEVADSLGRLRGTPIVTLAQALGSLGLIAPEMLHRITEQEPALLRDGHRELVRRALLTPDELGRALALAAGLPEVDPAEFELAGDAFKTLPPNQAREREVLPLGVHEEVLYVASGTPTDEDQRRSLGSATSSTVLMVWASTDAILARLDREEKAAADDAARPATIEWAPSKRPDDRGDDLGTRVQDLVAQASTEVDSVQDATSPEALGDRSGMARLVRRIVQEAQARGASDIHIECSAAPEDTLVRLRIDGEMHPYLGLPYRLRPALVSRIKIMARLDISERRRPQDGKIDFARFGGDRLKLRVAVVPTHDGLENVVLRLLGSCEPLPLSQLGLQPRDETAIARLSRRSYGLVLAAGPTGSGKTTTLHSMLMQVNTPERKIWTAEDPIEITQPGLNQVQVNASIGFSFAAALRSFLRADPDVIMIGEIRDPETARIAVEASLTGHLVLSTLHTNSAAESVARLLELGLDPLNFADSLLGVVAQRLVRGLCPHCAGSQALDGPGFESLLAEYVGSCGIPRDIAIQRLLAAAGVDAVADLRIGVATGCPKCQGKGYLGRLGIYEILESTPDLRELVQHRARSSAIFDEAIASGMRSLRQDAIEKVVQGKIDLVQARMAFT